jgi:RHS repeat-associated protein
MTQTKTNDPANPSQQRTVLLAVDLKNSVLAEIDAGNTNRIAYSPYGHQSAQQEVASQLGFNGERWETTPGWYFLGNGYRVYNPRLMRFHSPDNMSPFDKGGLNAYMYCGGEPIMRSDPTGHAFGILAFLRAE